MAAKSIMVQGTMSNVGKSVLTAGLCRIFKQDGYRAAPFKSQNMALNSFITRDGLEMGRAQAMQAEAAGLEPTVQMNPILLKPSSDVGSQVIVNGEVLGNMPAVEYFRYKRRLIPEIMRAYHTLADQYDIIVLEGAGSPAEINLKAEDIVNMGMARMARAPVLLAGDIDRGGVFASLYGTLALLEPDERAMVRGTIINKFRGDVEILRPGLTTLEELCQVPVVGVVPWMDVDVDAEDSLSRDFCSRTENRALDVAVVHLPRISNFTDFSPLERHPKIGLRYVDRVQQLGQPDLVILPGTKSTLSDLAWLRQSGLEAGIQKLAGAGTAIIGICGGYQMLGQSLSDPYHVEGGGSMRGMGLLPIETVFSPQKTRSRTSGAVPACQGLFQTLGGCPVEGYEIHMGTGTEAGLCTMTRNVLGTYLHGFFDSVPLQSRLIELLMAQKGLACSLDAQPETLWSYKQKQYDKLADGLRAALDMSRVYEILHQGL